MDNAGLFYSLFDFGQQKEKDEREKTKIMRLCFVPTYLLSSIDYTQ